MAKKATATKKSNEPRPAAKKAAAGGKKKSAKKAAAKQAGSGAAITQQDLAQVYAKAWVDDAFRTLLETDPTAALKQYAAENGLQWTKLVAVPPKADQDPDQDENCIHLVSCC
jgi:hypothetical protein